MQDKIEEFLQAKRSENKFETTLKYYKSILNRFAGFIGNKPLEEITAKDVSDFINSYKTSSTKAIYGLVVMSFLKYFNLNLPLSYEYNPPKIRGVDSDYLFRLLRNKNLDDFDRAIITFMGSSGLRASELISLKIKDIDFNLLTGKVKSKGQSETEEKDVFIFSSQAKDFIRKYLGKRINDKDDYLFIYKGKKIKYKFLWEYFTNRFKFRPHQLRHFFCFQGSKIYSPKTLQTLARHRRWETTSLYVDADRDKLVRDAVKQGGITI
jgi:integrase/recombinase XerD